jgi:hypothetical protein
MPRKDVYGFFGGGENPVRSVEVKLVEPELIKYLLGVRAAGPRNPDYSLLRSIPCELLITREDGLAAVKSGQYEGEVVTVDLGAGIYVANDPKGRIKVSDENGLFLYIGDVKNGEMSGFAKITRKIPKSPGGGDDEDEGYEQTVTFEGEVSHGLPHGYGKQTDRDHDFIREGHFFFGWARETVFWREGPAIPPKLISYDGERNLVTRIILSENLNRNSKGRIAFLEDGNMEGIGLLIKEQRLYQYGTSGKCIRNLSSYYLYGEDETTLVRIIEVNYAGIDLALRGNSIKNLESLLTMGFIRDISETKGIKVAKPLVTFEDYRECLTKSVAQNLNVRFGNGDPSGVNSTQHELNQLMLLSNMASVDELRRIRFAPEGFSYRTLKRVTSLLESIRINQHSLLTITENYISLFLGLNGHAASAILDLEEMRKIVGQSGWNALDETDTTLFYIYDSSTLFGARCYDGKYEKVLGVAKEKGLRINMNVQGLDSCWLHAVAAQVTAMKNPHLVANLKSGIKLHSLSKDGRLPGPSGGMGGQPENLGDILNGFVAETLLTLQRIADAAGVNLPGRRLLVGHVVRDSFFLAIKVYFDNEILAKFLEYRIRIVFGVFEEKFRGLFSQSYRKILTERHSEQFKREVEKKDKNLKQLYFLEEEAKNDRELVNFLEKIRILEELCDRLGKCLVLEVTSLFSARNEGNAVCYYEHRDRNDGNIDRSLKVDYGRLNRLCSEHKIGFFSDLLEEILEKNVIEDVTGGTTKKLETPDEVILYLSHCLMDLFVKNWTGEGMDPEKRTWLENNLRVLVVLVNELEPYHLEEINDIIFLEGDEQPPHNDSNVDPRTAKFWKILADYNEVLKSEHSVKHAPRPAPKAPKPAPRVASKAPRVAPKPASKPAPVLTSKSSIDGDYDKIIDPGQAIHGANVDSNCTPISNHNSSQLVEGEYRSPQHISGEFGHVGNPELINPEQTPGEVDNPKHLCLERLQGVDKNIDDSNLLGGAGGETEKEYVKS